MLAGPLALVSLALAAPLVAASPAVSLEDRTILDTIVAGATGTLQCPDGYTYGSVTDKRTIPASLKSACAATGLLLCRALALTLKIPLLLSLFSDLAYHRQLL